MRRIEITPLRRALIALGIAGALLGVLSAVVIATSGYETNRGIQAALSLIVCWSFLGNGLLAWDRRPDNLIGPLMVSVAFAWVLRSFASSDLPGLFALGFVLDSLPFGIIVHLLFAFPDGRLQGRRERVYVGLGYVVTTVFPLLMALFFEPSSRFDCGGCPPNPLLVSQQDSVVIAIAVVENVIGIVIMGLLVARFVRRARSAPPQEARRDAPVWWVGGGTLLLVIALLLSNFAPTGSNVGDYIEYAALLLLSTVPFAFWFGLVRSRLSEAESENVRLDAALQERLDELRQSRARIVGAGDAARRRLERDLHDGAQQRLVSLALDLRLARGRLPDDPGEASRLLDGASAELAQATEELRELARGIHPAVLSDRGLATALGALASRAPLPVELETNLNGRLAEPVESAAYFVVAEALTNVARHAEARQAEVQLRREDGCLVVEVRDDGLGGAHDGGSGLQGLADRVGAVDGEFEVVSPPGDGTTIRARIPLP